MYCTVLRGGGVEADKEKRKVRWVEVYKGGGGGGGRG